MNIINAIINLVKHPVLHINSNLNGNNRANIAGYALEEFIKDLFADAYNLSTEERLKKIQDVFSYLGNNSNPPDAMLIGGDAIEIKKIQSPNSALALNSSYPKHTLKSSNPMISSACRDAENWSEKDMLYIVGVVEKNNILRHLCMVYGTEYCASEQCYSRIKKSIKDGVESIPNIDFAETNELGKVNGIDPLGITYLRVRGMWGIKNPWNVFSYIYERDLNKSFTFMCIVNDRKWASFNNADDLISLSHTIPELNISNVYVKNPDNPAKLISSKLITFYTE